MTPQAPQYTPPDVVVHPTRDCEWAQSAYPPAHEPLQTPLVAHEGITLAPHVQVGAGVVGVGVVGAGVVGVGVVGAGVVGAGVVGGGVGALSPTMHQPIHAVSLRLVVCVGVHARVHCVCVCMLVHALMYIYA